MATLSKEAWKRRRLIYRRIIVIVSILLFCVILALLYMGIQKLIQGFLHTPKNEVVITLNHGKVIDQELLTVNEYSRPQIALEEIKSIVLHNSAEISQSAAMQRDYYENLKNQTEVLESVHYIIGLEGEIIQCIPLNEIAYASRERNLDSIAIEYCYKDPFGKLEPQTYQSLIELCAAICKEYQLEPDDIIRHFDVSGIACPKYFVDEIDAFAQLKEDVAQRLNQ